MRIWGDNMRILLNIFKEKWQRSNYLKYSGHRTMSDGVEREFLRTYFGW